MTDDTRECRNVCSLICDVCCCRAADAVDAAALPVCHTLLFETGGVSLFSDWSRGHTDRQTYTQISIGGPEPQGSVYIRNSLRDTNIIV